MHRVVIGLSGRREADHAPRADRGRSAILMNGGGSVTPAGHAVGADPGRPDRVGLPVGGGDGAEAAHVGQSAVALPELHSARPSVERIGTTAAALRSRVRLGPAARCVRSSCGQADLDFRRGHAQPCIGRQGRPRSDDPRLGRFLHRGFRGRRRRDLARASRTPHRPARPGRRRARLWPRPDDTQGRTPGGRP